MQSENKDDYTYSVHRGESSNVRAAAWTSMVTADDSILGRLGGIHDRHLWNTFRSLGRSRAGVDLKIRNESVTSYYSKKYIMESKSLFQPQFSASVLL